MTIEQDIRNNAIAMIDSEINDLDKKYEQKTNELNQCADKIWQLKNSK